MEQRVYGRFLSDLGGLRELMKKYGMIATGRSVLKLFDGSVEMDVEALYFYVQRQRLGDRGVWELSKYFMGQGYEYDGEKPEGYVYRGEKSTVYVRVWKGKPVEKVFRNPSTGAMTVLTWYGGYCLFPELLKERKFAVTGSGGSVGLVHNLYYLKHGFTEVSVGDESLVGKRSFLDGQSQFVRFREGGDAESEAMLGLDGEVECLWENGLMRLQLVEGKVDGSGEVGEGLKESLMKEFGKGLRELALDGESVSVSVTVK